LSGGGLSYGRYSTGASEEWIMRIGTASSPPVLLLPPLFEEMNRTRAFLASIMRALAARGFGCWLPDLPGTGESETALETCTWDDWRNAALRASEHVASTSGKPLVTATFRGGALLDDALPAATARWRFAPAEGTSLARDLIRSSMLAPGAAEGAIVELAGYRISNTFLADLRGAQLVQPERLRTLRLESDRGEADLKLAAPALWRRSEPANSLEAAELIASDIKMWADQCGIC
jgi:alpha-beta hydrolase superfamily lysophospholipase